MSAKITIHLVRHGESRWNAEGRYQGQADSGLSKGGRRQVEQFAEAFAAVVASPDAVLSSDLPRVLDTARGYAVCVGAEIRLDPAWREMNVGDWAGLTFEEAAAAYPHVVARVAAGEDVVRGVGGETFTDTRKRVVTALLGATEEYVQADGNGVIVVFTSGNPIRLAAAHALGLPNPGHTSLVSPDNCSVTTLRMRGGRCEVVRYNHVLSAVMPADQREIS